MGSMDGQEFLQYIYGYYESYLLDTNCLECSDIGEDYEGPDLESEPVRIPNFKAAHSLRLKFSGIAGDNSKASFLTKAETADLNSEHSEHEHGSDK